MQIERASDADAPTILELLREAKLPIDGLVEHLHATLSHAMAPRPSVAQRSRPTRTGRSFDQWSLHPRHVAAAWGND